MTRYLTAAHVLAIHDQLIHRFGGTSGVRDEHAFHAAVGRPENGYYADLIEQAAAFFESLAQNHPFIDGNKRTAFTATAVFLAINGSELVFDDIEAYEWLMALYNMGRVNKTAVESWLRSHTSKKQ